MTATGRWKGLAFFHREVGHFYEDVIKYGSCTIISDQGCALKDMDPLDFAKLRKLSQLSIRSIVGEPLLDFAHLLSKLVKKPHKSSALRDVRFIGVVVKEEGIESVFVDGSPELAPWSTIDALLAPTQPWCPTLKSLLISVKIKLKNQNSRDWYTEKPRLMTRVKQLLPSLLPKLAASSLVGIELDK